MSSPLQHSYWLCQQAARRSGSNFYLSFLLLPRVKRRAMAALYAFLRHTDDLGDSDGPLGHRRTALQAWREEFRSALAGHPNHPLLPAVIDSLNKFSIPTEYLFAAIDGVEMDLDGRRYQTFSELEDYCYHVAGTVGLACLHIWGTTDPAALEPARHCGTAFQLVNILRDLYPDARAGRIYLPLDDLRQCGCSVEDWPDRTGRESLQELIDFEVDRAMQYFRQAERLPSYLHRDGEKMFGAMFDTYRELLRRVEKRGANLSEPVGLGLPCKLRILTRAIFRAPYETTVMYAPAGAAR